MRRGGGGFGGGRRFPSLAPSTGRDSTPARDGSFIRNLESAFSRGGDSDVASLCSSRAVSTASAGVGAAPNFSDRGTRATALRVVNKSLAPTIALKGPLPVARDIQAALRLLVDRLGLPRNDDDTFEDDLIQDLRLLGCPYKVTRSKLKAPGTPHAWPAVLAVLHWLAVYCHHAQGDDMDAPGGPSNEDLMLLYATQGYSYFLSGDDDAVAALDEQYTFRSLCLEAEKEAFMCDIQKFVSVLGSWEAKISERKHALGDLEKELEAKVLDIQRSTAEVQDLRKQVDAQPVSPRGMERMHRDMQAIEDELANAEKEKAALEDKVWEVEAKLVSKLEEIERLAEKCNQALTKLKHTVDFQFTINSKGSSPAEMLGTGYKTVLKPALEAHVEENKRIYLSNQEKNPGSTEAAARKCLSSSRGKE